MTSWSPEQNTPLTFAKDKRIQKRRDFLRVQRRGQRAFGRFCVLVAAKENNGRLGITVPKKVGNACLRNLIKRRVRHIFRHNPRLLQEKTLVFIAKEQAASASFTLLEKDILFSFNNLRVKSKKPRPHFSFKKSKIEQKNEHSI